MRNLSTELHRIEIDNEGRATYVSGPYVGQQGKPEPRGRPRGIEVKRQTRSLYDEIVDTHVVDMWKKVASDINAYVRSDPTRLLVKRTLLFNFIMSLKKSLGAGENKTNLFIKL